jgi:hypothetical protein
MTGWIVDLRAAVSLADLAGDPGARLLGSTEDLSER